MDILDKILTPEFDYNILIDAAKGYRFPRNKIGALIKSGKIIRVKKGCYVKSGANYDRFVVANMIYGPSYISEDTALSHYGLIPERVEVITSTSLLRVRSYDTPIGRFEFKTARKHCYSFGIVRHTVDEHRAYLIASPEKALFDRIFHVPEIANANAMREYLFANMRLNPTAEFNQSKLRQLAKLSGTPLMRVLIDVLREESNR